VTCSHPNIARLSSISPHQAGPTVYLVSLEEFLPGGTLTARIQTLGLLSAADLHSFGSALVSAVGHIASHDLVHRDLKPDNVMLRADGHTPVIVDFGLVRNLAQASLTQTWLLQGPGTPLFSPAEQLHNEKSYIDWRADQFSLGVLLSIAVFGFHPYAEPNDTPADIITRVSSRDAPTERFMQRAVGDGFPALIRMVAPWPVQRFRTPEKLSEAWRGQ
jgi:serine/threonine protein kinase